jgi:PTH1 family peptidyl-tRNA hydrolase
MIVGLGNPGSKYEKTKHNIGFMVVDHLAKEQVATFKTNPFEALVADFFVNGEKVLLVKPQTFMNDSGRSVGPLMTYFGVDPKDLVVIFDDLDLELGKIRLRQKGSAGGHNGMKSIIAHLDGLQKFDRIKVGIGRPKGRMSVVDHVLSPFHGDDAITISQAIDQATKACEDYIENGDFSKTMNQFN